MTDHQDKAGETAPLQALSERWRLEALRLEMRGRRVAAERNKEHADQLDAALSRLSAPQGEMKEQESDTRVEPLKAGDDGQDLPQSGHEPSPSLPIATESADCHHCNETMPNGRCWWCGGPNRYAE